MKKETPGRPLTAAAKKSVTSRMFIELALRLMRDGNFGKPENNFKLSVIKKYVRSQEFFSKY
jgi:hypothetical protein